MVTPDRPEWTDKLRVWLTDTQFRHIHNAANVAHEATRAMLHRVERRVSNGAEHLETAGLWAVCLYYGHKPVADGTDAEDDRCEYCEKSMPFTAHGPQY